MKILCFVVTTAVAVALKVTDSMPVAAAFTVFVPAAEPNVSDVLASPLASVVADSGEIVPPPPDMLKVTVVPA